MPDKAILFLLIGGGLCAIGALAGMIMERSRLGYVIRDQAARNAEMRQRAHETEARLRSSQDEFSGLDTQYSTLSSFLVVLPDVFRALNSQPLSKRSIAPLLESLLRQLFDPGMLMIYTTNISGDLVLVAGKGLPHGMTLGHRIKPGDGQLGAAAMHQMAKDREDMASDAALRRAAIDVPDFPQVSLDLLAPIVHSGRTLGVIAIADPIRRLRDQKRMIKLIADLGALALENADTFSRLNDIANRDPLTQLGNKRFLNVCMGQLIHESQQGLTPLSVILFDIDHFKRFNDTHGHLAGDRILKSVAHTLRTQLRSDDIPARYGGEEFVVVLPNTEKVDAVNIAEKIRAAIEADPFPGAISTEGSSGTVTISGGVAALGDDGHSSQAILGAADQALYTAKEKGRNRVHAHKSVYLSEDVDEFEGQAG